MTRKQLADLGLSEILQNIFRFVLIRTPKRVISAVAGFDRCDIGSQSAEQTEAEVARKLGEIVKRQRRNKLETS